MRWYQIDPGAYLIRFMQRVGWVWNVWLPDRASVRERRARAH